MLGAVEWCYRYASESLTESGLYTVLDNMLDKCLTKYLLKKTKLTSSQILNMSYLDIVDVASEQQYFTLLSYVLLHGIENVSSTEITTIINWMLSSPDIYETGLIAYIWCNSTLNDSTTHSVHSTILEVIDYGCDFHTLKFLWRVANANDSVLSNILLDIARYIEVPNYFMLVAYTYVCSKCSVEELNQFFADNNLFLEEDLKDIIDVYTSYLWTPDTFKELLEKKYTMHRLSRVISRNNKLGIISPNREFPTTLLRRKHFSKNVKRPMIKGELIVVPDNYSIEHTVWNTNYVTDLDVIPKRRNFYEDWFKSLSAEQLNKFCNINPIVFKACEQGDFQYVEPMLKTIVQKV